MNCKFLFLIGIFFCFSACDRMDDATKKQIKKNTKLIGKQIKSTAEHFDGQHQFIDFEANKNTMKIKMYWKDDDGNILGSLENLKKYVESKGDSLLYACNGGMYMENQNPLGGFVQNKKQINKLNLQKGSGNFYLKPKCVFFINKKELPDVESIETQENRTAIHLELTNYLTQSGPMLICQNKINPLFVKGSTNLNIRNGVGILPNGNAIFAMSTYPICFYDFAKYFAGKGCKNALYLGLAQKLKQLIFMSKRLQNNL